MNLDERLQALTMNLELAHRGIQDLSAAMQALKAVAQQHGENIEALTERSVDAEARHDREIAEIRAELRRAILLSLREARQERVKGRELDDRISQLAATVKQLVDIRHGNGNPPESRS